VTPGTGLYLGYELNLCRYVFDRVFNQEATQSMVFEHSVKPLLAGVLDGYNATVFAYGVSLVLTLHSPGTVAHSLGDRMWKDAHNQWTARR
jgi:hypothetical protein